VAEHDADRGDPEEKGVPVGEPLDGARGEGLGDALTESAGDRLEESPGDARGESSGDEQSVPFDEEAAWKSIVEGYGEEPPDPPGSRPFRSIEDLALPEPGPDTDSGTGGGNSASAGDGEGEGDDAPAPGAGSEPEASTGDLPSPGDLPSVVKPLGSSIAFAPGVGGPRDYRAPEPSEGDFDEDDEGHFVPPEPPPLPAADTTAKFAWLGVLGGPALLLLAVLFGWDMTWWLTTLGIGGFLGGFATLVTRMKDDDEDHEDPGRGAVV
jgi:hypothetical protein